METDEAFGRLVELAQETGVTLGTAESVTGGRLAHLLTRQPGSGDAFAGAIVTYQTKVKQELLGVPEGPVVSHRAAQAMASGARRLLDCDLVISITGVAGPDPQDGQPVGCVFIGAVFRDEPPTSSEHFFDGSPDAIRQSAAVAAAAIGHEMLGRMKRPDRNFSGSRPATESNGPRGVHG
jgi:nicotinamide-nucleotide amidase